MKKAGNWIVMGVRPSLIFLVISAFFAFMLWFQLGSLVPGLSESEVSQAHASQTLQSLVDNPLNLPHKSLQFIAQKANVHDAIALRAVSTIFGLLIIGAFYLILTHWYTRRIALLGTLLFASSSWFLSTARHGTDIIMFSLLITTAAVIVWLQKSHGNPIAVYAGAVSLITLLYIPGMVWFILPAVIWQSKRLKSIIKDQYSGFLSLVSLGVLVAVAPLLWAFIQDPELLKTYAGLPQFFPEPKQILRNIADIPVQLFFKGPDNPEMWLARLPYFDWFTSVMFLFGMYAYFFKRKLDRTWFIAYVGVIGTVLVALEGPVKISILLPFVYLMAAGGIALMLQQWLTVFPKNPLARTVGVSLVTIAVLLSSYYNVSRYYIAWPNAPETKAVYRHRL